VKHRSIVDNLSISDARTELMYLRNAVICSWKYYHPQQPPPF